MSNVTGVEGLMKGKKGLITGIANDMSIAWAVAQGLYLSGAELAITYQGEKLLKRVEPLAQEAKCDLLLECDVTDDGSLDSLFSKIEQKWGKLDFMLHAIAFSDKEELRGRYVNTTRQNFLNSMDISCYSLTAMSKKVEPLMKENGGSILTLTYYGSQKAMPSYNVMGVAKAALESSVRYLALDMGPKIRVNAISPGPMRTLASAGIGDFKKMQENHATKSPLGRNTTPQDVAGSALYFLSHLSSGVTGEVHFVDCGYNIFGV